MDIREYVVPTQMKSEDRVAAIFIIAVLIVILSIIAACFIDELVDGSAERACMETQGPNADDDCDV